MPIVLPTGGVIDHSASFGSANDPRRWKAAMTEGEPLRGGPGPASNLPDYMKRPNADDFPSRESVERLRDDVRQLSRKYDNSADTLTAPRTQDHDGNFMLLANGKISTLSNSHFHTKRLDPELDGAGDHPQPDDPNKNDSSSDGTAILGLQYRATGDQEVVDFVESEEEFFATPNQVSANYTS